MLKEAIEFIVKLGSESKRSRLIKGVEAHPRLADLIYLEKSNGEVEEIKIPAPLRAPVFDSVDDLKKAVGVMAKSAELYVSESGIVVFLDSSDRLQTAKMPFAFSERFTTVMLIAANKSGLSFAPKDAVRFLKTKLQGTGVAEVAKALSKVDFTRTSSGKSHVDHGRETLGKSVEATVQQADAIPESFSIDLAPFSSEGIQFYRTRIEVSLYLDMENGTVVFSVFPDEIEKAKKAVLGPIRDKLQSMFEGIPVFMGKP